MFGLNGGKTAIVISAPLHRGSQPVAIRESNIVPHTDLITVVEDRTPRHSEKNTMDQFEPPEVVA
jgi:hypothetical protein